MFNNILKEAFADLQTSNQLAADEQLAAIEAGMEALEKEVEAQAETSIHDEEYRQLETGMFQLIGMVEKLEVLDGLVEKHEELGDAQLETALLAFNQIMEPTGIQMVAEDVKKEGDTPAEAKKSFGEKIKGGASSALATLKKWIMAFIDGARRVVQKYLTLNGQSLIAARKVKASIEAKDFKASWSDQFASLYITAAVYLLETWDGKMGKLYDTPKLNALVKLLEQTSSPVEFRKEMADIISSMAGKTDPAAIKDALNKAVTATKKYLNATKMEKGVGGEVFMSPDMGGSLVYAVTVPAKGMPRVSGRFTDPRRAKATSATVPMMNPEEMVAFTNAAVSILEGIVGAKTAYEDMRAFEAAVDSVVKAENAPSGIQTAVSAVTGMYQEAVNLQMTHSGRFARMATAAVLQARAKFSSTDKAPAKDDKAEPEKK